MIKYIGLHNRFHIHIAYDFESSDYVLDIFYLRNQESEYALKGIKLGDKKSDVTKVMGNPSEPKENDEASIVYYFKVENDNIQSISTYKDIEKDKSGKYIAIIFTFDANSESVIDDNCQLGDITILSIVAEDL